MVMSLDVSSSAMLLNFSLLVPVTEPATKSIVPAVAELTIKTPLILARPAKITSLTVVAR